MSCGCAVRTRFPGRGQGGPGTLSNKISRLTRRGIPGLERREAWGTPRFPQSTFKDDSPGVVATLRYTRAGDVGHPLTIGVNVERARTRDINGPDILISKF